MLADFASAQINRTARRVQGPKVRVPLTNYRGNFLIITHKAHNGGTRLGVGDFLSLLVKLHREFTTQVTRQRKRPTLSIKIPTLAIPQHPLPPNTDVSHLDTVAL